ncbi:hypothetical protein AcW1_010254 [Taiwanofungus camphoratus]|nr:hypothetical protein AcW1_010254 [Antrodia cinnamomea]
MGLLTMRSSSRSRRLGTRAYRPFPLTEDHLRKSTTSMLFRMWKGQTGYVNVTYHSLHFLHARISHTSMKDGMQHVSRLFVITSPRKTWFGVGRIAGDEGLKVAITTPHDGLP